MGNKETVSGDAINGSLLARMDEIRPTRKEEQQEIRQQQQQKRRRLYCAIIRFIHHKPSDKGP